VKTILIPIYCASLAVALTSLSVMPARADPGSGLARNFEVTDARQDFLEKIQFQDRRDGRRYSGYRGNRSNRNFGRNATIGIGAAIIGGIVLSEAARSEHRQQHAGDWQRCADTYKSFEPSTGMYTSYDGERRTCPYLN
jgi:opacity protein-like surface antigen